VPPTTVAACDRTEGLEPTRHARREALLAADVGREDLVVRRLELVGAVGAPELLQHLVRRPGELEGDV